MNLTVAIDVFSKEMRLAVRAAKAVDLYIVLWQSEGQVSYKILGEDLLRRGGSGLPSLMRSYR
jgi:hypothetical protein